jgi:hypothetical protein
MQPLTIEAPTLEELGERGRLERAAKEKAQWELGEIAMQVVSHYGEDNLGEWAKLAGIGKKSAQEYRRLCAFFEKSAREAFLEDCPNVFYSHFRLAKRLQNVALAYRFLDSVALYTWSVDEAEYHLMHDPEWEMEPEAQDDPEAELPPLLEGEVRIAEIDTTLGMLTLWVGPGNADAVMDFIGRTLHMVLTE